MPQPELATETERLAFAIVECVFPHGAKPRDRLKQLLVAFAGEVRRSAIEG